MASLLPANSAGTSGPRLKKENLKYFLVFSQNRTGSDLLRFRFRVWKSFGFGSGSGLGSGSRQFLAQFSNNKIICTKSCLFNVRSSILSQKVGLSFF
jgi:hypothetical protein